MTDKVSFPQPEVDEPKVGDRFYFADITGNARSLSWGGYETDFQMLSARKVYLSAAEAEQRAAWNRQEMARRVIPKWFRNLGPDVEWFDGREWVLYSAVLAGSALSPSLSFSSPPPPDWSNVNPAHYRAKPKPAPDVVVNVNGREYRWPATAKYGDPQGDTYICAPSTDGRMFEVRPAKSGSGNRTHHTREGAEAQCAALNAALGIEQ